MTRGATAWQRARAASSLLFAFASCGTSDARVADGGAGDDGGVAGDAAASTHDVPVLPQVPMHGGHVIAHMKLVTITFENYAFQSEIQAFGDWIVGSQWLSTVGAEYGVGAGTHIAKLVVRYTPPAVLSANDIEQYIAAGITMRVFPQPDDDTIYAIYYPPTTKPSGLGCDGPWWGHRTVTSPVRFTYAAMPACPPPAVFGWTQVESIEQNASHEIIEAATNPSLLTPSFEITDKENPFFYMGTEIGDLCVGLTTREAGFLAQRVWSNAAAGARRPPCVPAIANDVVFGASPVSSAPLVIAAGASKSVSVRAWASAAIGAWTVVAAPFPGYGATMTPTATLDRTSMREGDTATLTVSVPAGAASGSHGIVVVDSVVLGAGGVAAQGPYEWPVLVEVP